MRKMAVADPILAADPRILDAYSVQDLNISTATPSISFLGVRAFYAIPARHRGLLITCRRLAVARP